MQINDQIISFIARKCSGQANKEELGQLQAWIESEPGNKEEYDLFVKIWKESGSVIEDNTVDTDAAWSKIDPYTLDSHRNRGRHVSAMFLKRMAVAASVIIVAGTGYYFWAKLHPSVRSVQAASNQSVLLPDGSTVSLRKGSSIRYSMVFNSTERLVQLDGEAFFQVVRSKNQPFRVVTDRAEVKVSGTSFLVRSGDSTDEVIVASGKVNVINKEDENAAVVLTAGQKAVLERDHVQQSASTDSNYMAWKTGVLDFHNASMLKVIEDLEHSYATPIDAERKNKASIAKMNVTVHFENQSLDEVLNELTLITGLAVKKEREKIIFFEK